MAKVYAPPAGYEAPGFEEMFVDGRFDIHKCDEIEDAYIARLARWCRANSNSKSELVGTTVSFPYADGAARYMVYDTNPLSLIHLALGDAWNLPEYQLRGLRVSDIKEIHAREERLRALFEKKKEQK